MNRIALALMLILVLLAAGCRQSRQATAADLELTLVAVPFPAVVGEARLVIRVTDTAGMPVDDATLAIKGDMTHAGMEPVLAGVTGGSDGYYTIPFEWTMGGDWVVTVAATRPDGAAAEQRFDVAVGTSADDRCMHEEDGRDQP